MQASTLADYLTQRNGTWHFVRRVPDEFKGLDLRGIVRQSTKIKVADDPKGVRAERVAHRINTELEAYWRGLVDGRSVEARTRYMEARRRARAMGFDYATVPDLMDRPWIDVLERLDKLAALRLPEDEMATAALLGGEPEPQLLLSQLFARFKSISAASLMGMSRDQLRRWENPKKLAAASLITVIGDKAANRVSRSDALDFRGWLQNRVIAGELEISTANKQIGHLNKMWRTVDRNDRLSLPPVFSEMRIEGETTASRIPYPPEFVQDRFMADGALVGFSEEERCVLYLIAETGLRLSEALNLSRKTIFLDGPWPHVAVRPHDRKLKTEESQRDIPLVGAALMAMQARPDGFPHWRDRGAQFSADVNEKLRAAGLCPGGRTLYSLRHTFEDRLTAVEAPEKMMANLMGHKYARPKYGSGPSLKQKQEWLQRIAFKPPSRV